MRCLLFLTVGFVALWGCVAVFGDFEENIYEVAGSRLFMSGEITPLSPRSFKAVIRAHPEVETIVLLDMPGSVDEEAVHDLGYFIRDTGLNTHLTPQSEVYSGAVDLFLAGTGRTMTCCGTLGVHDWADNDGDGSRFPRDSEEHDANVAYTQDMLGSDAFYWFTLQAATSDRIHVMTQAEIARFGLLKN